MITHHVIRIYNLKDNVIAEYQSKFNLSKSILFVILFSCIFKMIKKIVISRFNNIAAIIYHKKVQELIIVNNTYQVNDIYIGIVQKIFSSINAAFIKLNKKGKSGFIHVNDTKALNKSKYTKHVTEILSLNQLILVQIIKEPTLNKGPRLTANINITGRYMVLMPFRNTVCISHKIYDRNERIYLHSLGILLKPATMGILMRSSAQGMPEEAIIEDLRQLKQQWNFIEKAAISACSPCLIYKEEDLIKKIIRDYYKKNIRKIIIDSQDGLQQIQYYINKWQCIQNKGKIQLELYNHTECILEKFQIKDAIVKALKKTVKLSSGGYIVIENNEALTVIDVNSGSFNPSDNSQETILMTNLYAAIEIAYQLRLRNINGVIIIDFIDMESAQDQLKLLENLHQLLQSDNAKPQIVQLSKLGLVELTRRRKGQSLQEIFNSQSHSYLNANINCIFKYRYLNYKDDIEKISLINKDIHSLFFDKKFKFCISINHKQYNYKTHKIRILNDSSPINNHNMIQLAHINRNYIVPLVLYSNTLIKMETI